MFKTKKKKLQIFFESDIDSFPIHKKSAKTDRKHAERNKGNLLLYMTLSSVPIVLVLGNSMIIPVLPDMQRIMNISQFQTSLTITLFSISAGLFIPVLGYLSDRFNRKSIIIPSLIVYGLGGVLAGFAAVWHSFGLILIARIIQGLGAAGTAPIAMALVGDLFKGGMESKALGLIEAANGTGKVLSPIIGSLLAFIIWYAAFFAFPVFCLISLLAVIFFIKEPKKKKKPMKLKPYLKKIVVILKKKGRWLVTSFFVGSLALFILFGVLFYLSDLLENKPYSIDGVLKGFILAIPLLGMVFTSYITGSKIKKNGVVIRWLLNIGLMISVISLSFTIFYYKNIYLFITLITLSSIGTGLVLPCINTLITGSVSRKERGMITSLYSSLRFFGVAFGPPLFSWLMSVSHQLVFITVTSLSSITLILVFFLIRPEKTIS
ncbi:MFS transporter [Chengkuizengella axinellae]|uniref:MFS transporter n=1 Tax=Chengkuizengella axinellae TaxID=3064388 RepID=A0ABT9IYV9_9BACL|nr:MFS transporter [Chengkuizengella sp. 2205SS18-9]MDP5274551.1 MFS transporter [Chengkuizengella sp. 2205SS18-9]